MSGMAVDAIWLTSSMAAAGGHSCDVSAQLNAPNQRLLFE